MRNQRLRRAASWAIPLVVLAIVAAVLLRPGHARESRKIAARVTEMPIAGTTGEVLRLSAARESDVFQVRYRVEDRVEFSLPQADPRWNLDVTLDISATVTRTRYDEPEGCAGLRFSDVSLRLVSGGEELPRREADRLIADMTGEAVVWTDSDGALREFGFASEMEPTARIWLRQILLAAHVAPPPEEVSSWEREEEEDLGWILTRYEAGTPEGAEVPVTGSRLRIVRTTPKGAMLDRADRVDLTGSVRGRFDRRRAVWKVLDAETVLRAEGPAPIRSVHSRFEVHWNRTGSVAAPPDIVTTRLERRAVGDSRDDDTLLDGARRKGLEHELAGESLTTLLARLRAAVDREARGDLRRKLVKLFLVNDRAARDAAALIRSGMDVEIAGAIVGALGCAGTPAAQAALREVVSFADLPEDLRSGGVIALALVRNPEPQSIDALRSLATGATDGVRLDAWTGLGAMARNVAADPSRMREIAGFLRGLEETAVREGAVVEFVAALGNAGAVENIDVVLRYAEHADAAVRAQALYALRLMEGTQARDALLSRLSGDADEEPRLMALEALTYRPVAETWHGIDRALTDSSARVRRRAVGWLADRARTEEAARTRLSEVAQGDGAEEVRRAAASALSSRR